jgi:hypothetical protein
MHLWVAIKFTPLFLQRDPNTLLYQYRLDNRWFLPSFFNYKYAYHVEIVLTHPCTKTAPRSKCMVCDVLPKSAAQDQFDTKHYLTYSVDEKAGCVHRRTKRHIVPPQVIPANDEHWAYWRVPTTRVDVAFAFLEGQIGKPIRPRFSLNFWLLCRRDGVLLESDFHTATHWYCSELASAALILCSDTFARNNVRDPCLISPCMLESLLRELPAIAATEADVACIPAIRSVRTFLSH